MSIGWSLASATTLSAVALSGPALAQDNAAPVPPAPAAAQPAGTPAPSYLVVRREHDESASLDDQTLNVACPKALSAFGAGYGANIHRTFGGSPGTTGAAAPSETFLDTGLTDVVSRPAANGSSWTVTGKPDIAAGVLGDAKWKLWVSVICAAAPPASGAVQ